MNATAPSRFKSLLHSLPEIWYIILIVLCLIPGVQTSNSITLVLGVTILALLIKQIFKKSSWLSITIGSLLTIGALLMMLALFSEYSEFQVKSDPKAIQLLLGGIPLIGTSLVFSILMLCKGIRRMI